MRVHVLHHAACFDGAASSAIFTALYRARVRPDATFVYIPKAHRRGDPFEDEDFEADDSAIVDFRYSTSSRLGWFFDHHKSAFQMPGQREHFDADRSGQKFHDDTAPSCTGYIATIGKDKFGFDPTEHTELLHWAEIIDTASFPNPQMPVELSEPALQLMTFVEQNRDGGVASRFIGDLLKVPLQVLAATDYVQAVVAPALRKHRHDIELMRQRCRVRDGVAEYDLSDQPPSSYNKFIAYYLHPDIKYLVGVSTGPDGRIKLSAGYNPWLPAGERQYDIAALCEGLGGGGHPYVGGVSFAAENAEPALDAQAFIASVLRGGTIAVTAADREAAAAALVTLRRRVDDHFAGALARSREAMRCGEGCEMCCHVRISVFAIEADRIAARLRAIATEDPALRERVRAQADDPAHADRCALLVEGRCVVYEERPMICRSHGVPARVQGRVSCCPLNFADAPAPAASVLELDAVNRPLALMATLHDGRGDRIALDELAR